MDSEQPMRKQVINPKGAPPPSGPYSRAIKFGNMIFLSGISSRNPDGTSFHGSVEEETEKVLDSIRRILEGSGSAMAKVLKVTVILKDSEDWSKMNSVYSKYFASEPPARTTFQSDLGNAKVEMDAIAYV